MGDALDLVQLDDLVHPQLASDQVALDAYFGDLGAQLLEVDGPVRNAGEHIAEQPACQPYGCQCVHSRFE